MKITITGTERRDMIIPIPSAIALNPVTALLMPGIMKQNGVSMSYAQAVTFIRAINEYRRRHPEWVLVEVIENDGSKIEIRI